jgi:hypothetical protein
VAVYGLGLPLTRVARALGVTPMPLARALARGQQLLAARGLRVETLALEGLK